LDLTVAAMSSPPTPPAAAPPGLREVKLHRDDTNVSFGFALASQKNGDKIVVTVRTHTHPFTHTHTHTHTHTQAHFFIPSSLAFLLPFAMPMSLHHLAMQLAAVDKATIHTTAVLVC
jgi:hypothetical protein